MADPQLQLKTITEGEGLSNAAAGNSLQIEIELFSPEDHGEEILSWWKGWGKKAPTLSILSTAGYVVRVDKRLTAAAWAHFGNSKLGHIGFPCTNPSAGRRKRLQALGIAIRTAESFLKGMGMEMVKVDVDNRALTKMLIGAGFELLMPHDFLIKRVN